MIDGWSVQDTNIGIKTTKKQGNYLKSKVVVTPGRKRKEPALERDPQAQGLLTTSQVLFLGLSIGMKCGISFLLFIKLYIHALCQLQDEYHYSQK